MARLRIGSRFEMIYKKLRATLEVTENGYVVKAGSEFPEATQEEFAKNHPGSSAIRAELIRTGAVQRARAGVLEATRDLHFDAPSTASSVLRGGPGERAHWKGPDNKNLRTVADFQPADGLNGVPPKVLVAIQDQFHSLIRERASELISQHGLRLPRLAGFWHERRDREGKAWFTVPGMYGGFAYWFEGSGEQAVLIVESWSRATPGSGQRHRISKSGAMLVAKGFI